MWALRSTEGSNPSLSVSSEAPATARPSVSSVQGRAYREMAVAGVLWARTEVTRWAGSVLAVAGASVGVMVWRLLELWEATSA